ncbi:MAG: efflux RND transporter permease subunit [Gemmatimonadales bacterium]|nr:MAG: efflux RND transporter permease subunit [Gemmatimonadales bacterium]
MSLSRLSVRRPVAVSMFFLAVVLLGLISLTRLPIDLLPDVSYPRLVIYTAMPQTSSTEVERLVTERVEAQVASAPGIERITSVSRDGVSLVTLRFGWGTNMDFAMLNVRERLDQVRQTLPVTASRPQILRVDPDSEPIMTLSVAGPDLWETKELAENVFRRRLEQLDGVAQAQVSGGLDREIVVEVDLETLEANGLTMQSVATALDQANRASAGGTILEGRTRYPLRTLGEFRMVAEISDVVVAQQRTAAGGTRTIRVSDVGVVVDGFADREVLARYNGRESVGLLVFKESGANTVQVARDVEEVVGLLQAEFPEVTIDVANSQAGFIAESIDNVLSALILGGMLAFLVLFLFLRQPRYPVAVALAIPISVVGTFALMEAFGVSLNIMSLGGLALGVGMLVDNSIIVLENIFRHRESGADALDGSATGAEEVSGAITASTLTTISVFAPIIYVEGVAGELFRDLSLAVAFSLLTSLAVALTLLPTVAARFRIGARPEIRGPGELRPGPRPAGFLRTAAWGGRVAWRAPFWALRGGWGVGRSLVRFWGDGAGRGLSTVFGPPLRAFDRGFDRFAGRYHRALDWALDHRGLVLAMAGGAMAVTILGALLLDRDLLPRVDQGAFDVAVELPEGTALHRTNEVAAELERILLADDGVEAVFGTVGRDVRRFAQSDDASGLHTARFQVRIRDGVATQPVLERLRRPLVAAGGEGQVTIQAGQSSALGQILGGSDADISVRVRGQNLEAAFDYADQVAAALEGSERVMNVRVGTERGQPQIEVQVLREEIARYGLQASAVAGAVDQAMRGIPATEYVAFDRKVPVTVRLPDAERFSAGTLDRIRVSGVPLRQLITVEQVRAPSEVRREEQGRVVTVLADVASGGLDRAIGEVEEALAGIAVPQNFRVEVGGENEEMRRSFRDLAFAFGLAMILVYMILAAQFESFLHPGTILAAVPLALIGAVLALLVAGEGLNTMSLIGIVILVGIVVNDSIVKVDFIVQARARGAELREAILEAGRVRLRPIIMTTVTTVLGLTPMALGIGRGADLRAPLAIAVIGGLIVATLLTLIIVPVLFSVVETARLALVGDGLRIRGADDAGRAGAPEPAGAMARAGVDPVPGPMTGQRAGQRAGRTAGPPGTGPEPGGGPSPEPLG